jgi:gamma-glutamyltranspeptidase/glutathione hydrolase
VEAPRIHHQWLPDEVVYEAKVPRSVQDALAARGHRLAARPRSLGEVQAIMVDSSTGARAGWSDPRWPDGKALGY